MLKVWEDGDRGRFWKVYVESIGYRGLVSVRVSLGDIQIKERQNLKGMGKVCFCDTEDSGFVKKRGFFGIVGCRKLYDVGFQFDVYLSLYMSFIIQVFGWII